MLAATRSGGRGVLGAARRKLTTLAAVRTSNIRLAFDETTAKRSFVAGLQEAEAEEAERVSACTTSQLLFEAFRKARRASKRAESLVSAGRERAALDHALAALAHSRSLDGEYGPSLTIEALRLVIISYTAQKNLKDAEPFARELFDRHKLLLGERHPSTLQPMQTLASILAANGRYREAAELLELLVAAFSKLYGAAHPFVHKAGALLDQAVHLAAPESASGDSSSAALGCSLTMPATQCFHDELWLSNFFDRPSTSLKTPWSVGQRLDN